MNVAALLSYLALTAFTPGPNNLMAMTLSAKFGLRRGLSFCGGVFLGFLLAGGLCAALCTMLFSFMPKIVPVMEWLGAGYILFLAYIVWRDKPHKEDGKEGREDSVSLIAGIFLQLINPKVILSGITVFSVFILPYTQAFPQLVLAVLVFSLMGLVATCTWAFCGSMLQGVFQKYRRVLNTVMALLLVYCAVSILL